MSSLQAGVHRLQFGLLALAAALSLGTFALPAYAADGTPILTEESTRLIFDIDEKRWVGDHEALVTFKLEAPSRMSFRITSDIRPECSSTADVEIELLMANGSLVDKYKTEAKYPAFLAREYNHLLPAGDYQLHVKQTAPSDFNQSIILTANAYKSYAGTDYQVASPDNHNIAHAAPIGLDRVVVGSFQYNYSIDYENKYHDKRYYSFTLEEPTNVKFSKYSAGAEKMSLVRPDGTEMKEALSPYDPGQDTYGSYSLDCGKLEKGTHYLCLEALERDKNDHSAFGSEFQVTIKTSHEMYRMYNPNSGEHLYTASTGERDTMRANGWNYEGVMWYAPLKSDYPIYRLYNPNNGDHHYASTLNEYNQLGTVGWKQEGIAFYSNDDPASIGYNGVAIDRFFNRYNKGAGAHHYVCIDAGGQSEFSQLLASGWEYEGKGWTGMNWKEYWE